MNKEKTRKILDIITAIVLISLFAYTSFNLYKTYTTEEDVFFFGYKPIIMQTDVMEPSINKYDLILIKKADFNNLKVGSIVYYDSSEHSKSLEKITRKTDEGFRTKNEINARESLQVLTEDEFIGLAICLFNTSYIINNPIISGVILVLLIALIFVLKKFNILSRLRDKIEKRRKYNENKRMAQKQD